MLTKPTSRSGETWRQGQPKIGQAGSLKLVESRPRVAQIGPISVETSATFAETSSKLAETRPNLIGTRPGLAETYRRSDEISQATRIRPTPPPQDGRSKPKNGEHRHKYGRTQLNFVRKQANAGSPNWVIPPCVLSKPARGMKEEVPQRQTPGRAPPPPHAPTPKPWCGTGSPSSACPPTPLARAPRRCRGRRRRPRLPCEPGGGPAASGGAPQRPRPPPPARRALAPPPPARPPPRAPPRGERGSRSPPRGPGASGAARASRAATSLEAATAGSREVSREIGPSSTPERL